MTAAGADRTAEIERVVDWHLRSWKSHPEWSDIRQEALIRAWRTVTEVKTHGWQFSTLVAKAALWAALDYAKAAAAAHDRLRPLEEGACLGLDWTDALLERLVSRQIAQRLLAVCTEREREVVERLYWQGQSRRAVAAGLGVSPWRVTQLERAALARGRRLLGLEPPLRRETKRQAAAAAAPLKCRERCERGHEWTVENVVRMKSGRQTCKLCHRDRTRRYRERQRAATG